MMSYSTIAIIYNPNSTGSSEELARGLKKELAQALPKQKLKLIATQYPGHADEIAYTLSMKEKKPLIISSSGDGGYHEVINGALRAERDGAHPTVGLLPAGNANDHYRNLHHGNIVKRIEKEQSEKIDVLKVTGTAKGKPYERYAHSYIGFGLTPQVGNELNKTKLNFFTELFVVTRSLLSVRPVRLQINGNVRAYESIIFSNIDQMSKYLKISNPSSVKDGKFEVTIYSRRHKLKLILRLLRASFVNEKEDAQVKAFSLRTIRPTLIQADGEITTLDARTDVHITIEKQALTCIV